MLKRNLTIICFVLCLAMSGSPFEAQTQLQLNRSAARELQAAEAEMNSELTRLFALASKKPRSIEKLKEAQSAWRAFRDAHVKAFWPSDEQGAYGSVHPMCVAQELARLTKERVAELRKMTRGVEGDVCACQWPD
jgi:uncharacterized protein YecT (DUF1311 family)